jgi:dihydroorotase
MQERYIIKGAEVVNEGARKHLDILIIDGRIERVDANISLLGNIREIKADGLILMPGAIDDQVHFREPGLTQKGDIFTESRAAVAGGTTSYMEMPNVVPQTVTQELLTAKYAIGARKSLANYSFYMGATNDNLDEVLQTNPTDVCGVKIFMGSSTGDMLVDNEKTLDNIFRNSPMLLATHCEDEATIRANLANQVEKYGDNIPLELHPVIRSREACLKSSTLAVNLAKKHNTRLHILHISTAEETRLFQNDIPLAKKRITAEACTHHLWFSDADYATKGTFIKWNPAVKSAMDRDAIWQALLDNRIDVLATDHAPHTLEEKQNPYTKAPSGGPLVQHAIQAMYEAHLQGRITLERMVEKMSHAPAICFQVKERGFIREGYWADLVLLDPNHAQQITRESLLYKCGWSPFEGTTFSSSIHATFVSGHLAWYQGAFNETRMGERLLFDR